MRSLLVLLARSLTPAASAELREALARWESEMDGGQVEEEK